MNEIFDHQVVNSSNVASASLNTSHASDARSAELFVKSNSIVSGSQRLKELQELHKELNKSSFKPSGPALTVKNVKFNSSKNVIIISIKIE